MTWWMVVAVMILMYYGCKAYGDRKEMVESDDWQGPSFQTCADAGYVATAFTTSRRREVVTFNHHRECTSLPKAWLLSVATSSLTP